MLVAATNPCPCGYAGEGDACRCSEAEMARHRRRLSGPLLDRIDLLASLRRDRGPASAMPPTMTSAQAREQVTAARERQATRLRTEGISVNAQMGPGLLRRHVRLDARGGQMLCRARELGMLSARGEQRVLRVARTVADLAGSEVVRPQDLAAALALRAEAGATGSRAA